MKSDEVKKLTENEVKKLFPEEHLFLSVNESVTIMHELTKGINRIEKAVLAKAKLRKEFRGLLTLPGIGDILGLTIMLEAGDIRRFPQVGDYSSYCRCVKSTRRLERKKQGRREQEKRQQVPLLGLRGSSEHREAILSDSKPVPSEKAVADQ